MSSNLDYPETASWRNALARRRQPHQQSTVSTKGQTMIEYINPDSLPRNPAFTNAIAVSGAARTIYVGAQGAASASGIVGKGDIRAQTEQVLKNLEDVLTAAGVRWEHVVKWNIYLAEGQPVQPAFEAGMKVWGKRANPPINTVMFVSSLVPAEFLIAIEAVAVVPAED
jgi:enamine deaminase RidA (YjgF/YER057c/UK114 family)